MRALIESWKDRFFGAKPTHEKARTANSPKQRGLRLEPLEERQLLAVTLIEVDELIDGPGTTLQEAIAIANQDTVNDYKISFSNGLDFSAPVDITLTSELDITDGLEIVGPGADQLTISGGDANRIFDITSAVTVNISGLTLSNGYAQHGGALRAGAMTDVTLTDVKVVDNIATSTGGGVLTDGGASRSSTASLLTTQRAALDTAGESLPLPI